MAYQPNVLKAFES